MTINDERREAAGMVRRSGNQNPYVWQTIRDMLGMPKNFTLPQIQNHLAELIEPDEKLLDDRASRIARNLREAAVEGDVDSFDLAHALEIEAISRYAYSQEDVLRLADSIDGGVDNAD